MRYQMLKLLQLLFVCCIGFVFCEVVFHNTIYTYDKGIIFVTFFGMVLVFYFVEKWLSKSRINWDASMRWIIAAYLFNFAVIQIYIGRRLEFVPVFDMGNVHFGAIEWLENGTLGQHQDYFYGFPNNIGILVLLRCVYGIFRAFGCHNYFLAGSLVGCASLIAMMWAVIQICRKLSGNKMALKAMLLMFFVLPLYVMADVFYTDVVSLFAVPLCIYFYLKADEQTAIKKKLIWLLSAGLVVALGMNIKFTVVIVMIALVFIVLLKKQWKEALILLAAFGIFAVTISTAVHGAVYPKLLDENTAQERNTPYLHWIMMGLQGKGSYSAEDYRFTQSFSDKNEQKKALKEEIKRRIRENKVSGMITLYENKTINCFGDGTFAASDFLDDNPVHNAAIHKYILYDGEKYLQYSSVCQGVFLFAMFCMICNGIQGLFTHLDRKKDKRSQEKYFGQAWNGCLPMLAFIGLWMFLMLWETTGRYFLNYISVMLICGAMGICGMQRGVCTLKSQIFS